jgi:hypothetical protein
MKLLIILAGICSIVSAQNPNDALRLSEGDIISDAKNLGMGNTGISFNGSYSSGLINPASFGLAEKSIITGGFFYNNFENNVNFVNQNTAFSNSSNHLSQLGIAVALPTRQGSMVFAVGYSKLKDFNNTVKFHGFNGGNTSMIQDLTSYNDDIAYDLNLSYGVFDGDQWLYDETVFNGNLNQSGTTIDKGGIDSWNISGAVELARDLFVGATLNIYSGSFRRERDYYEDDTQNQYVSPTSPDYATNDFQTFQFSEQIDWDLAGWDMKFGLIYRINKYHKFAATIKLPTQFTITEDYLVEAYSDFADGVGYSIEPYVSEIEYDITTPFELSAGYSFNISGIEVAARTGLIDYTQMEFSEGLTPSHRSDNNRLIKENFRSVLNYSLGASYILPYPDVTLRAGFIVNPSPYQNDPSEFDKKYFTAGLGFVASKVLSIDFAYVHGWWKTYGDNYGYEVSRTNQEISRDNIVLSLSYGI